MCGGAHPRVTSARRRKLMRGKVSRRNSVRGRSWGEDERIITQVRQCMRVHWRPEARDSTEEGENAEEVLRAERDMSNWRRADRRARLN